MNWIDQLNRSIEYIESNLDKTYEHSGGVEVEWYSDGDLDAEDYLTEIWIPIKEVKKHGTFKSDSDKEKRAELSEGQYSE